jgi:hypothetical protein
MKRIVETLAVFVIGLGVAGAASAQSGSSIGSLLGMIRDKLAQQGQISYGSLTFDSSNNRTFTNQFSIELSNITVDESHCRIGFHWLTLRDGKIVLDIDSGLPFRVATDIQVMSMDDDVTQSAVKEGHPTWSVKTQPTVWVVHLLRADGQRNTIDFHDRGTAELVAGTMRQVMSLCH